MRRSRFPVIYSFCGSQPGATVSAPSALRSGLSPPVVAERDQGRGALSVSSSASSFEFSRRAVGCFLLWGSDPFFPVVGSRFADTSGRPSWQAPGHPGGSGSSRPRRGECAAQAPAVGKSGAMRYGSDLRRCCGLIGRAPSPVATSTRPGRGLGEEHAQHPGAANVLHRALRAAIPDERVL